MPLYLFEIVVLNKLPERGRMSADYIPYDLESCEESGPVAVLFCRTEDGETATVLVRDWQPWFRVLSEDGLDPLKQVQRLFGLQETRQETRVDRSEEVENFGSQRFGGSYKGMISKLEAQRIHRLYGWRMESPTDLNTKSYPAVKITCFKPYQCEKLAEYISNNSKLMVADTMQKPKTRFLHDTGLCPCAWFTVEGVTRSNLHEYKLDGQPRHTISMYEIAATVNQISPQSEREDVPPLVMASFDGEMSSADGMLPSPFKGDKLFCLSTSFARFNTNEPIKTVSLYLGATTASSDDKHLVLTTDSVQDLVETWRFLVQHVDPDFVTGWNVDGFDNAFLANGYSILFKKAQHRCTETLQQTALDCLQLKQTPLSELCKRLSNGQRAMIFKDLCTRYGSPVAALARPSLGFTDGAVSLKMEDEDEDRDDVTNPQLSTLAPHQRATFRELVCRYLETCDDEVDIEAEVERLPRSKRDEFWKAVAAKHGPDAANLLCVRQQTRNKVGFLLSRFLTEECKLQTRVMRTAAKGDNIMDKIPMTGRACLDMMRIIKDDQKPASNSLRFAAEEWLPGTSKLDMPMTELFRVYKEQDADGAAKVIEYCARDAEIPLALMIKLQYITSWLGLCRVCYLNPDTIINGGQQQRVFSLITRRVRDTHAVNVDPNTGWPKTPDYVGATVIEPKTAFYTKPLSTLDFASLYPSIEASNNLCFSTLVTDRSQLQLLKTKDGKPLYQDFAIQHPVGDNEFVTHHYAFVTHVRSVLADLLIHLLSSRKAVKKQMEAASDKFLREVYNKRQLALKVVCNSVYGFTGVDPEKGMLSCKPVAAATTLIGRRLIGLTKDYVEQHFKGSTVVYGDTGEYPYPCLHSKRDTGEYPYPCLHNKRDFESSKRISLCEWQRHKTILPLRVSEVF